MQRSSGKRLRVGPVKGLGALLGLAVMAFVGVSVGFAAQFSFGFREGLGLVTVLAFVLVAWDRVDWRLMIVVVLLFFASEWVVRWSRDVQAATFGNVPKVVAVANTADAVELEGIVVVTREDHPLDRQGVLNAVCATLLAASLAPFWRTRIPESLRTRRTSAFLVAVVVVLFLGQETPFLGFDSGGLLLLGGVAYVVGLVWRTRGIVAGPVILQFSYLLSLPVLGRQGSGWPSALEMVNIGFLAFPFAFFGLLSNRFGSHRAAPAETATGHEAR